MGVAVLKEVRNPESELFYVTRGRVPQISYFPKWLTGA